MSKRSRNRKWLMGFETKRVHCPDGKVRTLTFKDFIWWQDAWGRRDAAALDRFDAIYGPGTRGSNVRAEPQEATPRPLPSVTETATSLLAKGIAAHMKSKGYA